VRCNPGKCRHYPLDGAGTEFEFRMVISFQHVPFLFQFSMHFVLHCLLLLSPFPSALVCCTVRSSLHSYVALFCCLLFSSLHSYLALFVPCCALLLLSPFQHITQLIFRYSMHAGRFSTWHSESYQIKCSLQFGQ
jgi:hypothetical protein